MGRVVHDSKCICINSCEYIGTPRKDFYFIGMSIVISLFSFFIYKVDKNLATAFLLFLCVGEIFNQIFFAYDLGSIEIAFGCVGFIYVLLEDKIKKIPWTLKR